MRTNVRTDVVAWKDHDNRILCPLCVADLFGDSVIREFQPYNAVTCPKDRCDKCHQCIFSESE